MNCPLKDGKPCEEKECGLWLDLFRTDIEGKSAETGRCAITWIPLLLTEIRGSLDRLQVQCKNKDEGGNEHEATS